MLCRLELCKEPGPIRLHSSVVLSGLGVFSPKPGLQKKDGQFLLGWAGQR